MRTHVIKNIKSRALKFQEYNNKTMGEKLTLSSHLILICTRDLSIQKTLYFYYINMNEALYIRAKLLMINYEKNATANAIY